MMAPGRAIKPARRVEHPKAPAATPRTDRRATASHGNRQYSNLAADRPGIRSGHSAMRLLPTALCLPLLLLLASHPSRPSLVQPAAAETQDALLQKCRKAVF